MEILGWDVIGWIIGLLITTGLAVLPLNEFRAAEFCFSFSAIILLIKATVWGVATNQPIVVRGILVGVISGVIGISAGESLRWVESKRELPPLPPNVEVRPVLALFRPIYAKFAPVLGKPVGDSETSHAYQGVHDHATVLWVEKQNTFFQIPIDSSQKWAKHLDTDWGGDHIYRDRDLIAKFNPPPGRLPPYAGVANRWLRDPTHWQWIGWRQWDCYFNPGKIFVQSFERGIILGPFPLNPLNKSTQGFILVDNEPARSEMLSAEAPVCDKAPMRD